MSPAVALALAPTSYSCSFPNIPGKEITEVVGASNSGFVLVQTRQLFTMTDYPTLLKFVNGEWQEILLDFTGPEAGVYFNYYGATVNEEGVVAGSYKVGNQNNIFVTKPGSGVFRKVYTTNLNVKVWGLGNGGDGLLVVTTSSSAGRNHIWTKLSHLYSSPRLAPSVGLVGFYYRGFSNQELLFETSYLPVDSTSPITLLPKGPNNSFAAPWRISWSSTEKSPSGYARLVHPSDPTKFTLRRPGQAPPTPAVATHWPSFTLQSGERFLFMADGVAVFAGAPGMSSYVILDTGAGWVKQDLCNYCTWLPEALNTQQWILGKDVVSSSYHVLDSPLATDPYQVLFCMPDSEITTITRYFPDGRILANVWRKGASMPVLLVPLPDVDRDGMSDAFEGLTDLNTYQDIDNDGLTNAQEFTAGTNPRVSDTDGDTISDGKELAKGLDPRDPGDGEQDWDHDNLTNAQEIAANLEFAGSYKCYAGPFVAEQYSSTISDPYFQSLLPELISNWDLRAANAKGDLLLNVSTSSVGEIPLLSRDWSDNWLDLSEWGPDAAYYHSGYGLTDSGKVAGWIMPYNGYDQFEFSAAYHMPSVGWTRLPFVSSFFMPNGGEDLFYVNWSTSKSGWVDYSNNTYPLLGSTLLGYGAGSSSTNGRFLGIGNAAGGQPTAMVTDKHSSAAGVPGQFLSSNGWQQSNWFASTKINSLGNIAYLSGQTSINSPGFSNYLVVQTSYPSHLYELPAGATSPTSQRRDIHPLNMAPKIVNLEISGYSKNGQVLLSSYALDTQWGTDHYLVTNKTAVPFTAILSGAGIDYPYLGRACFDENGIIHTLILDYVPWGSEITGEFFLPRHIKLVPDNDSDEDGIPDDWETYYYGAYQGGAYASPTYSGVAANPLMWDMNHDEDGDGLTNMAEYKAGTNPKDTDSDKDGSEDGVDLDPADGELFAPTLRYRITSIYAHDDGPTGTVQTYHWNAANNSPGEPTDPPEYQFSEPGNQIINDMVNNRAYDYYRYVPWRDFHQWGYPLMPSELKTALLAELALQTKPPYTTEDLLKYANNPDAMGDDSQLQLDNTDALFTVTSQFRHFHLNLPNDTAGRTVERVGNVAAMHHIRFWLEAGLGKTIVGANAKEQEAREKVKALVKAGVNKNYLLHTKRFYATAVPLEGYDHNLQYSVTPPSIYPTPIDEKAEAISLKLDATDNPLALSGIITGPEETKMPEFVSTKNLVGRANAAVREELVTSLLPVEIKEVSFAGSNYHELKSDDGNTTYNAPQWLDINGDGTAKTSTSSVEKNYTVAFTRNTKPRVGVTFKIAGLPSEQKVKIKASSAQGLQIPETLVTTATDGTITLPLTTASNNLPNSIQFHNADNNTAFKIDWEISIGSSGWNPIGSTKHSVCITHANPAATLTSRQETLFTLACRNAQGRTQATDITSGIWREFTDRDVRRVDGTQLTYYKSYTCRVVTSEELIKRGDGQCGSWAKLFIDLRKVHGIDDTNEYVLFEPLSADGFIVKNWTFQGNGKSGHGAFPFLNMPASNLIGASNYNWAFSEVNDAQGIPGQGNPNPASLFNNHQVVIAGNYYDPSYGIEHGSLADIDNNAIDGFYVGGLYPVDEQTVGQDLNGDGDQTDTAIQTNVMLFKKNPAGLDLKERRINY